MRNLFRSFERFGLEYLLISGQASILYGAATFSEDVDVWIRPTRVNANRLLTALASCRARVHKLPPPLSVRYLDARDVAKLQARDTSYWRPRIAELRRLRRAGELLPDGTSISNLLKR